MNQNQVLEAVELVLSKFPSEKVFFKYYAYYKVINIAHTVINLCGLFLVLLTLLWFAKKVINLVFIVVQREAEVPENKLRKEIENAKLLYQKLEIERDILSKENSLKFYLELRKEEEKNK